jgi:hypothetical protein
VEVFNLIYSVILECRGQSTSDTKNKRIYLVCEVFCPYSAYFIVENHLFSHFSSANTQFLGLRESHSLASQTNYPCTSFSFPIEGDGNVPLSRIFLYFDGTSNLQDTSIPFSICSCPLILLRQCSCSIGMKSLLMHCYNL